MLPHYRDLMSRKIGDVMTPEFIYVSPDTRLTRVLQIMVEHRIRSIIVLDAAQKLVGIIARQDVIAAAQGDGARLTSDRRLCDRAHGMSERGAVTQSAGACPSMRVSD